MSRNLLDTKTVNLTDIIGNGKKYKIPSFQRDYSWDLDQWEDLWLDMLDVYEKDRTHYMGAIVLQSQENNFYTVIDGQQRLTTMSLFIIAVIQFLRGLAARGVETEKNTERADILRRKFIGDKDASSLMYSSKLFLNENNDTFYQSNLVNFREPIGGVGRLRDSQKLIWRCFEYFLSQIITYFGEDGEKATIFTEKDITTRMMFIQITVEDELSAYTVFETLNSRGVELTTTDLLKNFLFSQVAHSPTDLDYVKTEWQEIINTVELKEFPTFLRYYINSSSELINQKSLFKFIKNQITDTSKVIDLLSRLRENVILYVALSEPNDDFWKAHPDYREIKKSLTELSLFGVQTVRILLLAGFRKFPDQFSQLLRAVSVISFRYNVIGNKDPKAMEQAYNRIARKIESGEYQTISQVIESLLGSYLYITDSEFRDIFRNKRIKISKRKLIKYILIALDNSLSGGVRDFDSDSATIEHILPENPSQEWEKVFSQRIQESYIDRLGNYLLLESGLNKNCENQSFSLKLLQYGTSKYQVAGEFADRYPEWNPETVEKLQGFYAKKAVEIWRI